MAASHVSLHALVARIVLGSLILVLGSGFPGCGGDPADVGSGESVLEPKAGSSDTDEKPTEPSGASEIEPDLPPEPAPPTAAERTVEPDHPEAGAGSPGGLTGRVTRADRGDVSGCLVELREDGKTVATATCDASGRFRFDRLPAGPFTVVAAARGFLPHPVTRNAGATDPVTIELRPGRFVRGRVLGPDGEPLPHFIVRGFRGQRDGSIEIAVTATIESDDGQFNLAGFTAGPWWVEIRARGLAAWLGRIVVKEGAPVAGMLAKLRRGRRIAGYVLDEATGEPIANVLVLLRQAGVRGLPPAYVTQHATTDDRGFFVAENLPNHGYHARVQSLHLLSGAGVPLGRPDNCPRLLFVQRGASIVGQLSDDRGEPVPNGPVELQGDVNRYVRTDREGRFQFWGLPTGRYGLTANGVREFVEVQRGFSFRHDLATGPRAACEGLITADGEPYAGCAVRVEGVANEASWWARSDERGRFEFRSLPAGPHRVVAMNPWGHNVYERSHDFVAGETERIECRLPNGTVEGLIEASLTARPLPGTRVDLVPQEILGSRRLPRPRCAAQSLVVGDDGLFRFDRVPPGRYVLLAWKEGYAMARFDDVLVGRDTKIGPVRITLSGGGVLRGSIRVGASSADAFVRLLDEHEQPIGDARTTSLTRNGEFTFRGLVPGSYTLQVHRLGCFERMQRVTVQFGGNPKLRIALDQLPVRSSQRTTGAVKNASAVGR